MAREYQLMISPQIVFTYILGYKVDIGHMEAVNLISSSKYSEKQIVRRLPPFLNPPHARRLRYLGLPRRYAFDARKFRFPTSSDQLHPEGPGFYQRNQ
jgi:hypothetical protein